MYYEYCTDLVFAVQSTQQLNLPDGIQHRVITTFQAENYHLLISDLKCSIDMQKLHTLSAIFVDFLYYLMDMKLAKSQYWGGRRFENLGVHILLDLHIIKFAYYQICISS